MGEVIYLTGAPASGKSTLLAALGELLKPVELFSYGLVLADYVGRKNGIEFSQDEIRKKSAIAITPEDVMSVDAQLLELVTNQRNHREVRLSSNAL